MPCHIIGSTEGRQEQHINIGSLLGSRYVHCIVTAHMTSHATDWLADIGLAQYRDIFIDGLIDGNMLNELTYVWLGEAIVIIILIII